jgi:hypothetical protein
MLDLQKNLTSKYIKPWYEYVQNNDLIENNGYPKISLKLVKFNLIINLENLN